MLKILAPTDFSVNSKAGLRFALQWATKQKLEIIFIHFFHTRRIPGSTDSVFNSSIVKDARHFQLKLERFILSVYNSTNTVPGKYTCIAKYGLSADIAIMDYCRDHGKINYICIATRGAGKLNKLFGTTTGNLTLKSEVPVITVPKTYRKNSIKRVVYATDLRNYAEELKKVAAFARPLEANIKVLHISRSKDDLPEKKITKTINREGLYTNIELKIIKSWSAQPLLKELQEQIYKLRPSIVVMFTDQHRNFFQKILSPSKAEQISFVTTIPLLAFKKS